MARALEPGPRAAPAPSPEDLSRALFERDLARETQKRLSREVRRLERRLAEAEADRAALAGRLAEREHYLGAIHGSFAWKLVQRVRGLFGRRW